MSAPAWQLLNSLPAWEITEIPRISHARADGARNGHGLAGAERGKRMQSLAAASRRGSPAAFGWVRAQARGPVRVIAAGDGLRADEDSTGPVIPLAYPAGANGQILPPGGGAEAFAALPYWVPVAIIPDALLDKSTPPGSVPGDGGPSPEDGLLRAWHGPFGWIVLAVPVGTERREKMTSEIALAQLTAQRNDSPKAQLAERRAKTRHDELRESASTGLWDIWLLAGAATPAAAVRVAALLTASLDLRGLPFGLTEMEDKTGPLPQLLGAQQNARAHDPGPLTRDVLAMHHEQVFGGTGPAPGWLRGASPAGAPPTTGNQPAERWPDPEPEFPCAASSLLLAALAVPPAREIPGIRLTLQPDFDVTPETGTDDGAGADGMEFGVVLDGNRHPSSALSITSESLNRHAFVCGATGSGKSQTVRHLLESAAKKGIPWLVIEPAKAEYRLMAARLPNTEVITIRPGDLDVVPAGLNPLEPSAGPDGVRFPLQAHADLVRALFMAAFQAEEPFPQVLAAALARCYTEAGWDLITGFSAADGAAYPGLADLQAAAMTVVDEIGYGAEVRDNIRGFVAVRIGSLRTGTTGRFLDGGFPLDYARLLDGNVVLEIEDCGGDTDRAFLTGAVLIRLIEHLRMRARAEGPGVPRLRHLTIVEEAHRLLRQPPPGTGNGPAAHAVEMFAGLLAEIRAYGEGLVIAEQIPSKLIPDVIKNTAIKIVHRLPAQDDRDTVGATMNLTLEQSKYLVTLVPGEAAVFTDGMDYPVLAQLPDGTERELASLARAASPVGLVTARSPACPPGCGQAPCTLRQISAAQRRVGLGLGLSPQIIIWAELAVAAHLAGCLMPTPGQALAGELAAMDTRLRDCAIAQAVADAVASRTAAFAARFPGPALAGHVAAAMRTAIDEERWACAEHEPQWDIAARRDARAVHTIMFGTRTPSMLEQTVGALATHPNWYELLAAAITPFPDSQWVLDRFRADPAQDQP
jgi:hypothetical protein